MPSTTTAMFSKFALISALATSALAQSSYMTGLLNTLRDNGLTAAADFIASFDNTTLSAIESSISSGNHTGFAPDNNALANLPNSLTSNSTEARQVLSYHFLSGSVNINDTSTDKLTIARTTLTGTPTVNLPGNQPQAIVLSKSSDGAHLVVVDAASGQNITSSATVKYQNLLLEVIPTPLTIPGNVSTTIASISDLSTLVTTAGSVDPNLPRDLSETKGVTIFAPVNSAFTANISAVAPADINKILLNHIINGTVAYSPQITNGMKITTAGGSTLTFATNSTGIFVTAANSTARVTKSDILVSNGVIHLIDAVLLDTTSNPSAASSAVNSATSAQASHTSTQTGPITNAATATGGAKRIQGIEGSVIAIAAVGLGALFA